MWLVCIGCWAVGETSLAQDLFSAQSDMVANPVNSVKTRFQFDYQVRLVVDTRGFSIPLTVYVNSADGSVGMDTEALGQLINTLHHSGSRDFAPHFAVWLANQKPAVYGQLRNTGKVVFSHQAHPSMDIAFLDKYLSVMQFLNAERETLWHSIQENRMFAGVQCSYYEATTPDRFLVKLWMGPTDIVSQAPYWNSLVGLLKNYHQRQNMLVGQLTAESQTSPGDRFTVTLKTLSRLVTHKSLDGTAYTSVLTENRIDETYEVQSVIAERREAELRLKRMQENCRTYRSNSPEKKACLQEYQQEKERVEAYFRQKYPLLFRE